MQRRDHHTREPTGHPAPASSRGATITALPEQGAVIVRFECETLDFRAIESLAPALADEIGSRVAEGCRHVVLSFAAIRSIDSSGLAMLFRIDRVASSGGARLRVCSVSPSIVEKLARMRVLEFLETFDTEEQALSGSRADRI